MKRSSLIYKKIEKKYVLKYNNLKNKMNNENLIEFIYLYF